MMDYIISGSLIIGLIFLISIVMSLLKKSPGTGKMIEIHEKIKLGAKTFLKKEYSKIIIFVIIVGLTLYFALDDKSTPQNEGLLYAIAFFLGATFSMLAGWFGMSIATSANVRTANAAKKGLKEAFRVAFSSGIVMGLTTSLLGLFGVFALYKWLNNVAILFGFGLGASSVALFARVGGGIFTKAADLAADLVGKFEHSIPEDDPRNPAVIADNVGDNVGDVAGMGADLFESYVGSLIAAMSIGITLGQNQALFPLILAAIGLLSSIIAYFFVRGKIISSSMFVGLAIANTLTLIASGYVFITIMHLSWNTFISIIIGSLVGILIGLITNHYTSETGKHAKALAKASTEGVANNILSGIAIGMKSTAVSIIMIATAIILAYGFGGIYGIALAGVAMLSTLAFSLGIDAYGPVADNAGGIAEMAKLPEKIRKITDELDAVGNTTAAIGKGFAIGSAALTSLALLNALANVMHISAVNLIHAKAIIGLFIGASLPFLFSSMTIQSVNRAAQELIEEVRKQFKDKAILEGKKEPNYARAIEIATEKAIKEMVKPGVLVVITPLLMGFLVGADALIAMLAGALVTGVMLGLTLSNSGGVWDNAKKFIESGHCGGKNSLAHKAAVIGDTVGDPFKDTSGPSLNILIKLMTIVSLVFAPLIVQYGGILFNFM